MLLKELIVKDLNLHQISNSFKTPFVQLLKGLLQFQVPRFVIQYEEIPLRLPTLLKDWLEDLQESSVDLEEYGRVESELYEQGVVDWDWDVAEFDLEANVVRRARWFIRCLEYGPSPSDWDVEMVYRRESAVEDIGKMPGGWIEDDDLDGEEGEMGKSSGSERGKDSEGEEEDPRKELGEQVEHEQSEV